MILAAVYVFMFALNWLTPLCYGDDYLYSFVWTGEQSFWTPLPESARRLSDWQDVFDSLTAHYFTHSGRTVIFLPVFFFLWKGKELFNFVNAGLVVALIVEIYWLTDRGRISANFKPARLCWIFFALWSFTVCFGQVFLWVTGSLNFLWPAVLLLGFLLPYARKWFGEKVPSHSKTFTATMFFAGLAAGWTNENTICWFILLLALQLYRARLSGTLEKWMIFGLLGLTIGYTALITAPGNWLRLEEDVAQGLSTGLSARLLSNSYSFFVALTYQALLWFFFRDTMKKAKDFFTDEEKSKENTQTLINFNVPFECLQIQKRVFSNKENSRKESDKNENQAPNTIYETIIKTDEPPRNIHGVNTPFISSEKNNLVAKNSNPSLLPPSHGNICRVQTPFVGFQSKSDFLRDLQFSESLAAISVLSNIIMLLVPEFPLRSTFPGSLYLIIAVTTLIRLQHETGRNLMKQGARIMLHVVGVIFFAVTVTFSFIGFKQLHDYDANITFKAAESHYDAVIEVPPLKYSEAVENGSMLHIIGSGLTENADSWQNVAFARYFGIRGIRVKGDM